MRAIHPELLNWHWKFFATTNEAFTCVRTVIAPRSRNRETIGQHRSGVVDLWRTNAMVNT